MKLSTFRLLMILSVLALGSLNLYSEEKEISVDINEWTVADAWTVSDNDCSISLVRSNDPSDSININCPFHFNITKQEQTVSIIESPGLQATDPTPTMRQNVITGRLNKSVRNRVRRLADTYKLAYWKAEPTDCNFNWSSPHMFEGIKSIIATSGEDLCYNLTYTFFYIERL